MPGLDGVRAQPLTPSAGAGEHSTPALHHVFQPGPAGVPALLLIHPLGADLTFWDECRAHWSGRLACVAVDLRGVGGSPLAAQPVPLDRHAADLEALRAALALEQVVPVGCAVGSMVAARYAARHPQRAAAVVLSNPALRTSAAAQAMLRQRAKDVRAGGMAAILPDAVDRAFLEQPRDARYQRYLTRFAAQSPEAYALAALAVLDADIEPDLAALRCPALVVAGGKDVLLPPEIAYRVHASLRDAELALLPEAAHFPPYQCPAAFAARVAEFVTARLPRAASASTPQSDLAR